MSVTPYQPPPCAIGIPRPFSEKIFSESMKSAELLRILCENCRVVTIFVLGMGVEIQLHQ